MKIIIIQNITNKFTPDKQLITSYKSESYNLTPDEGKVLKNKQTGTIIKTSITVSSEAELANYEEIIK